MKTAKTLKELPGFYEKLEMAQAGMSPFSLEIHAFDVVGDVVIPGLTRHTSVYWIQQLALMIGVDRDAERRRLRLVPPPKPEAANDCEAQ